jgi:thiamine biosynthesis lipoprotein ApbE
MIGPDHELPVLESDHRERQTGQGAPDVGFELFERCAAWALATGGAFDIATGALTKVWGFSKREGRVPPEPGALGIRRRPASRRTTGR